MTTTSDAKTEAELAAVGPPVPYDIELASFIAAMPPFGLGEMTPEMIPAMRETRAASMPQVTDDDLRRGGAHELSARNVPGPAGAPEVSLLICRPAGVTTAVPAVYHIHGGGMIVGDNRTGLLGMMNLAAPLGMAVVSVEYRLAPETPHPGPVEDCYAGLAWTAAHADELGIDAGRIIVGGASAGGGLSAAVALLARDRGVPGLAGQLLLCPMLDDRNDTASSLQMAGLGIWDHSANNLGWTALLGDATGGPDVSPYAAPARAADLSGLPPAYIDVGSAETFRDEDAGRDRRAARVARRLPRLRRHGSRCRDRQGRHRRARRLAAAAAGHPWLGSRGWPGRPARSR